MLRSVEAQSNARRCGTALVGVVRWRDAGVVEVTAWWIGGQLEGLSPCIYAQRADVTRIGRFISDIHQA